MAADSSAKVTRRLPQGRLLLDSLCEEDRHSVDSALRSTSGEVGKRVGADDDRCLESGDCDVRGGGRASGGGQGVEASRAASWRWLWWLGR